MFTGIVQEAGIVQAIKPTAKSIELTVQAGVSARGLKLGDSFAINGCCLTAVKIETRAQTRLVRFDLLQETWERTNLQSVRVGSRVNLERPLRADGELGGHFVTGHIDGAGKIIRWEKSGRRSRPRYCRAAGGYALTLIFKGSVAVDGISLTVAAVQKKSFRIWIIPHTFEITALCERKVGDAVNLEADLLGKYVEKFMTARPARKS